MNDTAQTPLVDLLRSVPADARLSYKHSPTDYSMIPAGRLCNEAADEIGAQRELLRVVRAERDDLAAEVYRLRAALRGLLDMDVAYNRGPRVQMAVEVARAALGEP